MGTKSLYSMDGKSISLDNGCKVFGALTEGGIIWQFTNKDGVVTQIALSALALTACLQLTQELLHSPESGAHVAITMPSDLDAAAALSTEKASANVEKDVVPPLPTDPAILLHEWQHVNSRVMNLREALAHAKKEIQSARDHTCEVLDAIVSECGKAWPGKTMLFEDSPVELIANIVASRDKFEKAYQRLDTLINNPHTEDFLEAVRLEAAHQRERFGSETNAGKTDAEFFWLVGRLAGKALSKPEKKLHHIITSAAALLNWHANATGASTVMRPGIEEPEEPVEA